MKGGGFLLVGVVGVFVCVCVCVCVKLVRGFVCVCVGGGGETVALQFKA